MSAMRYLRSFPFFWCGVSVVLLLSILYIVNGDQIPVAPHDQLDDQVLCYKMAVDHLGATYYPEFMGGQESSSAPLSIPGMLIFYLLFPTVMAFAVNLAFVMIVAYVSLYASLRLLRVRDSLAALVGLTFALLPFYSVYGLSSMGVPLVFCALLLCLQREKLLVPILLCVLYAVFSSLVWAGFAVCFCLAVVTLYYAVRRNWTACWRTGLLFVVLSGTYVACNIGLLASSFNSTVTSHRSEFVLASYPLNFDELADHFFEGHYHSISNHYYMAVFDIVAVVCVGIYMAKHANQCTKEIRILLMQIIVGLAIAFAIAVFWLFYVSEIGISLRSFLPESLRTFQADRFYWLYPCVWYVTTGLAFELVVRVGVLRKIAVLSWLVVLIVVILTLNVSVRENIAVLNVKSMIMGRESSQITWAGFYAEDLFEEIKTDIEDGSENEPRVISIGLHPSVALYNGLSTVDGYSVNYPLAYKHAFSQIIDGELSKSDTLNSYFWGWGSRCYAFSHELGMRYVFPKDSGISIKDFFMNVEAMKDMGADYVISGVPIEGAAEHGLELLGGYRTDESYYELWLYRIM